MGTSLPVATWRTRRLHSPDFELTQARNRPSAESDAATISPVLVCVVIRIFWNASVSCPLRRRTHQEMTTAATTTTPATIQGSAVARCCTAADVAWLPELAEADSASY